MPILLEIVTPEKKIYSDEVDSVVLPTTTGDVGILPGHIPLLTQLKPGELVLSVGNEPDHIAVDKGFAEVLGDKVSVLTEGAVDVDEIDLSLVEDAEKRAKDALAAAEKEDMDPAEVERLETIVRFSLAQKLVKERRR